MANAKVKGARIGRLQTTLADIPPIFYKHHPMFARVCGLSRTTVYKYVKMVERG